MKTIYLLMTLWIAWGCTKQPMPSPCLYPDCRDTVKWVFHRPDSFGIMPVQWYTLGHTPDTGYCAEICFSVPEGVIAIRPSATGLKPRAYVRLLDRETGKEIWYFDGINTTSYSDYQVIPDRHLVMVKQWSKNAIIDIRTGIPLFNTELPPDLEVSNPKGRIIGDFFYVSATKDNGRIHEFTRVLRTPIHDGTNWEEIYRLNAKDIGGYSPNIYNIGIWQNPQTTDSILLFNTRMLHWTTGKERSDVVAYNLSQRRVEWTIDSICKVSNVGTNFIIDDNYMYFNEGRQLSKIDLMNPQVKIYSYTDFGGYGIIDKPNNRMIGYSLGISSCALDHKEVNWKWDDPDFGGNGLELFEGYIYTQDDGGDLYVFNATTGKIVFQHFSQAMFVPQSILGMHGRCSVDKEHRLLYAADKYGVYCMKLPEKWE